MYLLQHVFWAKIMKFPDFSLTFLIFKISLTNLQNSLTLKKNQISDFPLTNGHPDCNMNICTFQAKDRQTGWHYLLF